MQLKFLQKLAMTRTKLQGMDAQIFVNKKLDIYVLVLELEAVLLFVGMVLFEDPKYVTMDLMVTIQGV